MQDLIFSLNGNVLKATTLSNGIFKSTSKDLLNDVVTDSVILNSDAFANVVNLVINEIAPDVKKSKIRLNFVVEPEDMEFKFVTVDKSTVNIEERIVSEIKDKLDGKNLDDLFFSYVKIAPFVYQFLGIKKAHLETYLEISDKIGVELHSVLPWVMLLPKYVGSNDSSIFVCSIGMNPVVVLSELGGVFFVGSYDPEETPEKLNSLVTNLSVYKRTKPINKVYTFNYPHLKDVEGLTIHQVEIPGSGTEQTKGFDTNLLVNYMLDLAPDTLTSQVNLLNMLPLPVVEKKTLAVAKVAMPLMGLLVAGLVFGGFLFYGKHKTAPVGDTSTQVLGEGKEVVQPTTAPAVQITPQEPAKELDRKDLVVRIENGSGTNGVAGATKEKLEALGYKVLEIDTSDESKEATQFKFKELKSSYKDMILKDTSAYFPKTEVATGVTTDTEYDLLIIIGTSQTLL